MARLGIAVSGRTLGRIEGLPALRSADVEYRVRRAALSALAIGALIAGLAAISAAIQGATDAGVTPDPTVATILDVNPTGYGWRAGIRPGQVVTLLVASDEPGGWRLRTLDANGNTHEVVDAAIDETIRATLPFGGAALGFACVAVLFLSTRRRWVLPAASLALLAASIPLWIAGGTQLPTAVMGGAALLPAFTLARALPVGFWFRAVLLVVLAGLATTWAWARLAGADVYPSLDAIRGEVALWGTVWLVLDRIAIPALRGEAIRVTRPRVFDVFVVAALAGAALVLINLLGLPPLVVGATLLVSVAVLPSSRRRIGRPIEDALLGDVREQAAAEAAEDERARLARELHDVPLQELAAVIRRLEIVPGTEAESENLRALAGHLRNVATELRPPVLDDLGLPAAIDFLAEESTSPAMTVRADVVDDTGFGAHRRPPSEVELAMFRIASEAVGNAVRHSGGSEVRVRASVAPDRVEIVVNDDGAGMATGAARDAGKRKRLGLASMRRRAQAIDAELSIDGSSHGTQVRVVWQA
jgi:two-component system sensor histidine kinase DegS